MDLFHRPLPSRLRKEKTKPAPDEPRNDAPKIGEERKAKQSRLSHDAMPNEQASPDSYWEQYLDDDHWLLPQTSASHDESVSETSAVVLAGLLLPLVWKFDSTKPRHKKMLTNLAAIEFRR